MKHLLLAALVAVVFAPPLPGYVERKRGWPNGNITLELQLDQAPAPAIPQIGLTDGSRSWNTLFKSAMDEWNVYLKRSQFVARTGSTVGLAPDNTLSNMAFARDVYGEEFGTNVLAVTLTEGTGTAFIVHTANDVLFNANEQWDSYRGALRETAEFRRVALHELGHVLGLNHPDEATPPQSVAAIMNSTVSAADTLQADDIASITPLYGTPFSAPTITRQPSDQTVGVTGTARLDVLLNGGPPPTGPLYGYTWFFTAGEPEDIEPLFTIDSAELNFGSAQLTDAGIYILVVETPEGPVFSEPVILDVLPIATNPATLLSSISTRGVAGAGDRSMIVGFAIRGSGQKRVLLRAVGPTLAQLGVSGVLTDPQLTIKSDKGADLATNDDWEKNTVDPATIRAVSGPFPLAAGSKDAVILTSLPAGNYTAIVSSANGTSGVALIEAYDLDSPLNPALKMGSLSTRGFVGTGENILIAGFNVEGPAARTFLIRAVGDSLQQLGVSGTLDDPFLRLYQGPYLLRTLDDWDSPFQVQTTLRETAAAVGAFTLIDRQEAVMRVTLKPGSYTAQVSGFDDGTGVALVEVYEVTNDQPPARVTTQAGRPPN